jgi:hypothetical protein
MLGATRKSKEFISPMTETNAVTRTSNPTEKRRIWRMQREREREREREVRKREEEMCERDLPQVGHLECLASRRKKENPRKNMKKKLKKRN